MTPVCWGCERRRGMWGPRRVIRRLGCEQSSHHTTPTLKTASMNEEKISSRSLPASVQH